MTLIPAFFALISIGIIWIYPLTEGKLTEIQQALQDKKNNENNVLSGVKND